MPRVHTIIITGAATLAIGLVGCGGGGDSTAAAKPAGGGAGGGSTAAALKMEDIKFDKAALAATKGQALVLSLTNAGALDHDFTIDKIDGAAKLDGAEAKSDKYAVHAVLKTKGAGKLEITPAATGTFEYYCSVAGHKEAGMKGTLTVK